MWAVKKQPPFQLHHRCFFAADVVVISIRLDQQKVTAVGTNQLWAQHQHRLSHSSSAKCIDVTTHFVLLAVHFDSFAYFFVGD